MVYPKRNGVISMKYYVGANGKTQVKYKRLENDSAWVNVHSSIPSLLVELVIFWHFVFDIHELLNVLA